MEQKINPAKKPKTATYEAKPGEVKKVILLYSGGLDTSVMLKWIQDVYKAEVITFTADLGQPSEDLEAIREKAIKCGAVKAYILDLKKEFANEYCARAIKANALYEGKYPLSSALARYLLAKKAVEIASKEKADACAHGCSGKGNDQVRFDLTFTTLNPKLKVIAPVREWGMTRDKEIEYASFHGIPVPTTPKSPYSIDENLWGRSIECGVIEEPDKEVPEEVLRVVVSPEKAPNKPEYVKITFEKGIPTALNGEKMELFKLIMALNKIGGRNGVGLIDHMEDRVVGLKSREFYECPAALILIEAHKDLEKYVSTIHENLFKEIIDSKWAQMVYSGLWFDPLMEALNAFIDKVNEKVTGEVTLKLYKGSVRVVARDSKYALYDRKLATYEIGQTFNQFASPGFIELWGLQSKLAYQIKKKTIKSKKNRKNYSF
jgi:argininosuccinate synthase